MSSEGSVTSSASRIRQFGLYRTIDARTEEFLRSSRRRQIRQGCACAAISTAIAVTVVVSVILVYEYSINSASNVSKKISVKPNWFGLMNDSEPTNEHLKFDKKISFDKATIKLLPILIKALNKNRYLEKIIEEYSSSSPSYESKNETENYFQRNVFSNNKNWLKLSSLKPNALSLESKSLPLVYTRRSPDSDYLSKMRKSRNYQTMLDYFNKMIGEKPNYSNSPKKFDYGIKEERLKTTSTNPPVTVKKTIHYYSNTTLMDKISNKIIVHKHYTPNPIVKMPKINTHKSNCKCPKKLESLLQKLIQNVKTIISNITEKKQEKCKCLCRKKSTDQKSVLESNTEEKMLKAVNLKLTTPSVFSAIEQTKKPRIKKKKTKMLTTLRSLEQNHLHETKEELKGFLTMSNIHLSISTYRPLTEKLEHVTSEEANNQRIEASTPQTPKNILTTIPEYDNYGINQTNNDTTTYKTPQDTSVLQVTTTESITPLKLATNEAAVNTENFLDSIAVMPSYKQPRVPLFVDNEYNDYSLTTIKAETNFDDLDVHSFELVKSTNIMAASNNKTKDRIYNMKKPPPSSKNYHPIVKTFDTDNINTRKMADLIYLPKKSQLSPISEKHYNSHTNTTRQDIETGVLRNVVKTQKPVKHSENISRPAADVNEKPTVLDENTELTNEDEFQEEWVKHFEITGDSERYNKSIYDDDTPITTKSNYESKSYDKINNESVKSMLPSLRPPYLEIRQNNEWRLDGHTDYDINLANNIFDLPDI